MKTAYMVATWREYPFENLLSDKFARDEDGIKAIIADAYNEDYFKQVSNFRFYWRTMEVTFSAKAPWDDEADQGRVYLVPIYEVKGGENKMKWDEAAVEIAREAWEEYGNDEEAALEYIHESVDGSEHVIYTAQAYDTVLEARVLDPEVFERAHDSLTDTEGDRISRDETIDDVITRLAYWILYEIAADHYRSLVEAQ